MARRRERSSPAFRRLSWSPVRREYTPSTLDGQRASIVPPTVPRPFPQRCRCHNVESAELVRRPEQPSTRYEEPKQTTSLRWWHVAGSRAVGRLPTSAGSPSSRAYWLTDKGMVCMCWMSMMQTMCAASAGSNAFAAAVREGACPGGRRGWRTLAGTSVFC